MAEYGREKGESAGVSSDEVDVAAVFERLKEEVQGRAAGVRVGGASGPVGARAEAERLWPVAPGSTAERRAGIRGALAYPAKRVLRTLMGWYVEPFASDQRSFNYQLLRLVDELGARLRILEERIAALEATAGDVPPVDEAGKIQVPPRPPAAP